MNRHLYSSVLSFPVLALLAAPLQCQEEVWSHFKTQYDKDGDGRITREEHGRGEDQFDNLDRDGDGVITEADFQRRRRAGGGGGGRQRPDPDAMLARQLGEMFGTFLNRDGEAGLSEKEWEKMILALEPDQDGVISDESLSGLTGLAGQGPMARMGPNLERLLDRNRDRAVTESDLRAVFAAMDRNGDGLVEQGTEIDMPPGVGEMAPDFTLPLSTGDGDVSLSSFRGKKPVALIFGSYT